MRHWGDPEKTKRSAIRGWGSADPALLFTWGLHTYATGTVHTLTVRQKKRGRKKRMGERDENAYIRFFALWFAAGMAIGVLLLLAASRTGMKEGNTVRLFQAEAFLGRKTSAKVCFSYLLKVRLAPAAAGLLFGLTAIGAYFAAAAVLAYGFLCGVFLSAAYLQNGIAGLLFFFLALFPQIFLYLAALFLMAAACSQMAETNHLAGGMQKKEYFRFGVRYFFALILLLWGILFESYVNPWFLSKIL